MNRKTIEIDRSRNGHLVHSATSSGRCVTVVAYIEGIEDPRLTIESSIICRTQEQAAEIARVLTEARFASGRTGK
jgi:hypothetical protein